MHESSPEPLVIAHHAKDGAIEGGYAYGHGFTIVWPNTAKGIRGAWITSILRAVIARLEVHQQTEFACTENQQALSFLYAAVEILDSRIKDRKQRGVLGTREP